MVVAVVVVFVVCVYVVVAYELRVERISNARAAYSATR